MQSFCPLWCNCICDVLDIDILITNIHTVTLSVFVSTLNKLTFHLCCPRTITWLISVLHTCGEWQCLPLAGLSCSLVHNKQQVLGLAKLPSKLRKRHTCAAWGTQSNGLQGGRLSTLHCIKARDRVGANPGEILTVMRAEEMVHWADTGKCDGSGM